MSRYGAANAQLVGNEFASIPLRRPLLNLPRHEPDMVVSRPDIPEQDTATRVPSFRAVTKPWRRRRVSTFIMLGGILISVIITAIVGIIAFQPFTHRVAAARMAAQSATQSVSPSERLAMLQQKMATIEKQPLQISIGATTITVPSTEIGTWLSASAADTVTVNDAAISAYVNGLAAQNTVQPLSRIVVTHPDGSTAVLTPGTPGFSIGSTAAVISQIESNLLGGQGMNVNLPGVSTPFQTVTTPTFDKLLEVDLTTKRMYAYENGTLIRTFLVTAGAPATPTPIGEFHIWEKLPIEDMRGFNPNGTRYFQPNVRWINYFDHTGDAVHGNYWRPASVFGNVNTSHGCVSVIDSDAEWIYNWAPIGTTVITHL